MFGILRPCRHSLPDDLASAWLSHLCGLCLALRDEYGQLARTATNYDGLVVSALVTAQAAPGTGTRVAGPCPLRGMRRAEVAEGTGARLAATVSLLLASGKITDHVEDGDGGYARWPVRGAALRTADRWNERARRSGDALGFDSGTLLAVVEWQREIERTATVGNIRAVTRPTEDATGQAFAHTALLAGRPENEPPLREAGRLFGRIAHLLDAVEDLAEDRERGAWNPIIATDTQISEVRRLCEDAVLGVRLALDDARFSDDRLVRVLLGRELDRAVRRTFARVGHPDPDPAGGEGPRRRAGAASGPAADRGRRGGAGSGGAGCCSGGEIHDGYHRPARDQGTCCTTPRIYRPPKPRGFLGGCVVATFMCGTCQQPCRDPYPGPWSGRPREAWCASCCDCQCCECCSSCRCGGGSGGGSGGGGGSCDCDCCCCD